MKIHSLFLIVFVAFVGCGVKPPQASSTTQPQAEPSATTTLPSSNVAAEVETGFDVDKDSVTSADPPAKSASGQTLTRR